MAALQGWLESQDVNFIWDSAALECSIEAGRLRAVRLAGGRELEGDEFGLGGGTWSPKLAGRLGLRISMQVGKGYSLTLL